MSTTRPWLAWYPADIFNDPKYLCLDRSAKLTYRELLDRAWLAGAILPADEKKLAALAGLPLTDFRRDWSQIQDSANPCFITHPVRAGFLTNKRLLAEWKKASTSMRHGIHSRPHIPNWHKIRTAVFQEDEFVCQYCGETRAPLECDHIIPLAKGGSNNMNNLITACRPCNRSKRERTLDEWLS